MLKKVAVVVGVLMILGLAGPAKAAYKEVSLNGDWDFTFKSKLTVDTPELPDASSYDVKLRVPDYMNFQTDRLSKTKAKWWKAKWQNLAYIGLTGTAFYRRFVDIPADWAGRSIQLYIGRAYDRINIWVNGKHIVFYQYICHIPLTVDLSTILKPEERNEIIISVDNMKKMEEAAYCKYGGIVSPVCLKVSKGCGRIDDIYIRPGRDLKEIIWQAELKIPFKEKSLGSSKVNWVVREWNSKKVIGKGSVRVDGFSADTIIKWTSKHQDIKPWHPNHPNLYVAELSWEKAGKVIDLCNQRFGLRKWSSEGRNLKLNDKPIYLRQFQRYVSYFIHYKYPQDKNYWIRFFQLIKNHGYNSFEGDGIIAPQELLEAADEIGMIIQTGVLRCSLNQRGETRKVMKLYDLWEDIVRWTRNYPSMSIYCLDAETHYYEGLIDDVCKINTIIKSIHPESMLMPSQGLGGVEYRFLVEDRPHLTKEPFLHHAERLEKITKCSDIFGQYPGGGYSYCPFDEPWHKINERMVVYKRPLISHEVLMMSKLRVPPFPKDGKFLSLRYGRKPIEYLCTKWGFPKSKGTIQQRIAKQDSKGRLHYENMFRLNSILCKYVFEKLRKSDNITGYEDLNGHGGLNMFLESGPGYTVEGFRRYNDDNVLLLDFDKGYCLNRCYWAEDKFNAKVMVSLYGENPVEKGTVTWKLKENNRILLKGAFKTGYIPNGKVTTLKDMEFTWPKISRNSRLNLAITLTGSVDTINNDWDFWVFKKEPVKKIKAACMHNMYLLFKKRYQSMSYLKDSSSEKLWIVDLLTDKTIKHLEQGGDVLLIGGKPFTLHTAWPTFLQGYRAHHNNGSVVYEHPVFENIPNKGWGDWQFYPLLEEVAPVVFSSRRPEYRQSKTLQKVNKAMKDFPFNPILEVIDIMGYSEQASIFELRAGKGRLFVSACSLDMKNAVCVTLIDSILNYMNSSEFNPTSEVKIETLRSLIGESTISISGNEIRFKPKDFTEGGLESKYSSFGIKPRDGAYIEPKKVMGVTFELKKDQIPQTKGKNIVLSIDGQDCDKPETTEIEIVLNNHFLFKGINRCVKKGWSIWNIPFDKTWLRTGVNKLELRNIEESSAGGHKWFMVAGAKIKPGGIDRKISKASAIWSNKPVEIKFKTKKWHKLNQGGWKQGNKIIISREGINKVYLKNRKNDRKAEEREVSIDVTPPILGLISKPAIQQLGGEYFAARDTVFSIEVKDKLSGVDKIEICIDGERYMPYVGSFMLGTGSRKKGAGARSIRCRCSDYAGNQTTIFTGGVEGGGVMGCIQLQIK